MKKLVVLLFSLISLLLPLSGYAQEYYSVQVIREQAQARWTQIYHTKWRDVTVDAQPFVPDVAAVPVLKVAPSFEKPTTTEEETGWDIEAPDYSFLIMKEEAAAQEKLNRIKTRWVSEWIDGSFDFGRTYANSSMKLGEAIEFLQKVLIKSGIDPKRFLLSKPAALNVSTYIDASTEQPVLPSSMRFDIYQQIRGIPILCHDTKCIHEPKDNMLVFDAALLYTISDPNTFSLYLGGIKETEMLASDIPLCDFSKIMDAIKKEIMEGHIRKVFDIDLGYVLYNEPGVTRAPGLEWVKTAVFYAVPTWHINCLYVNDPKKELRNYEGKDVPERGTLEYASLAINAQTGEMQDYMNNKDDSDDYIGFIPWDEVDVQN